MTTYSDWVTGTGGTTEASIGTLTLPQGARIIKLVPYIDAVGAMKAIRLDFAGMKTPQKYIVPTTYSQAGTEVGSGVQKSNAIDVDIQLPAGTTTVTIYVICEVASSTTATVGLVWIAP